VGISAAACAVAHNGGRGGGGGGEEEEGEGEEGREVRDGRKDNQKENKCDNAEHEHVFLTISNDVSKPYRPSAHFI